MCRRSRPCRRTGGGRSPVSSFSTQARRSANEIGRDVLAAAVEIEGERVRHRARDPVAGERHGSVGRQLRRGAERARCQFDRHRRHRLAVDQERQRQSSHHVVGIAVHVEGADVALLTDRDALARRGTDRLVAAAELRRVRPCRRRRRPRGRAESPDRSRACARRASRRQTESRIVRSRSERRCRSRRPSRRRRRWPSEPGRSRGSRSGSASP